MDFLDLPSFKEAVNDLRTIGVFVSTEQFSGSQAYAVVGGRSNERWWLLPLKNGRVTASGFALFQPLLASARIMKSVACTLSILGLTRLWARQIVYLNGESTLSSHFADLKEPAYAYFTGTKSPHRKAAVQVMDSSGHIKAFAKLGRGLKVVSLLQHETEMLAKVSSLGLKSAHIPRVLYSGPAGNGYCLLMDTLKTPKTRSITMLSAAHRAFLRELADRTRQPSRTAVDVAREFEERVDGVQERVNDAWITRLRAAVRALAERGDLSLPQCMSHGDFTPWNTFMVAGQLYVFDWEYAEQVASPGNDLIHFVLNQPRLRRKCLERKIYAATAVLKKAGFRLESDSSSLLLVIYLLTQVLRQLERLPGREYREDTWDGEQEQAGMLDMILPDIAGPSL